jgi:hypothetical protein
MELFNKINRYFIIFYAIFIPKLQAQVCLIKSSVPQSRIVLSSSNQADVSAAYLLQDFAKRITSATIPIVADGSFRKGDVIIGGEPSHKIKQDGFYLSTKGGFLRIIGVGNGSIYGVVTLLEKYLNVSYYGKNEYTLIKQKEISLSLIDFIDNPTFRYRQIQCYALDDPIYKMWFRLDSPSDFFAGDFWVHTFNKLLSPDKYGKTHPEYYAYYNGRRHPDIKSQWCLTNPDVFEIVSHTIDSIFKVHPGIKLISVSQNDTNNTYCKCDNCKKIDKKEKSSSGSLIYFLNKLAKRFPDKEFSTLAYLYSVNPPKYIKPLPNVNIMLCDMGCSFEKSLEENKGNRKFVKAMKDWAKISNNIFLWDYGINFSNYLTPFPNFHILQDNIRLFKKERVTMYFAEIGGRQGVDFLELRAYLIAKLMWNSKLNVDSLMQSFLKGYYGEAAPYLYQYINLMEKALGESGIKLLIYDSPVSHTKGMLNPELMKRYNILFDNAEKAVSDNQIQLKRVQRSRLSLQYSELEIAKTENIKDINSLNRKLDLFEERVREFNVPTLRENYASPIEYCESYRKQYLSSIKR